MLKNLLFLIKQKRVFVTALIIFLLLDIALVVNNTQNKTPIVGMFFDEQPAFLYTHSQLTNLIQREVNENEKPLVFGYQEKQITVRRADLGYVVDAAKTANSMLMVGRTGNTWQRVAIQLKALVGLQNVPLSGNVSKALLTVEVLGISKQVGHPAVPAHPDFTGDTRKIIPATEGVSVDTKRLTLLILQNINKPQRTIIPLPVIKTSAPSYSQTEIDSIKTQAQQLSQAPVSFTSGGFTFTLTPQDIRNMLIVVLRPDPRDAKKMKPFVRIDDTQLNKKLGDFSAKVEGVTRAEFNEHEARIALFNQLFTGKRMTPSIPTGVRALTNVLAAETSATPAAKIAYLTFDDGPNTIYHPLILSILREFGVHATFFLIGQNIPVAHDAAVQTFLDGNVIGNHTFTHPFLPNYSSTFIADELLRTNNIIRSITNNTQVTLFRPPYGGINSTVVFDAHADNLRVFLWDVDPRDWTEPPVDELVNRVVNATMNGSTVLMHSNHFTTVEALPKIITVLKTKGYTFRTLDQYPKLEEL